MLEKSFMKTLPEPWNLKNLFLQFDQTEMNVYMVIALSSCDALNPIKMGCRERANNLAVNNSFIYVLILLRYLIEA